MEKILEKSGKSQGILSVRKSGNPVKGLTCARRQHAMIKDGTRVSLFEPINNQKSLECSGRFKLRLFVSSSLLFFRKDTLALGGGGKLAYKLNKHQYEQSYSPF